MLLAIGLEKKLGGSIKLTVYEQAPAFSDDVGGAIGMYPNGFQVIRDIDPSLLRAIRKEGIPYEQRRWMKPDGAVVAEASEQSLCEWASAEDEAERSSIGIRRWRLQKVLLQHASKLGIEVRFGMTLQSLEGVRSVGPMTLVFKEGPRYHADFVFGCDGVKSVVRAALLGRGPEVDPAYTGVTVLMGAADVPAARGRGISFPASAASGFHAVYYPTGEREQVFQVFFSVEERPETWRPLGAEEGAAECRSLADRMAADGWAEEFLEPLRRAKSVLRVGLRARDPVDDPAGGRVVLIGDSWHPPVPYLGQGLMAGVEDVGVLLALVERVCKKEDGRFECGDWDVVAGLYKKIRVPRTTALYRNSSSLGVSQRARSARVNASLAADEWNLWLQIKQHGTLPSLKEGSGYNYLQEVEYWLAKVEEAIDKKFTIRSKL